MVSCILAALRLVRDMNPRPDATPIRLDWSGRSTNRPQAFSGSAPLIEIFENQILSWQPIRQAAHAQKLSSYQLFGISAAPGKLTFYQLFGTSTPRSFFKKLSFY